MFIELESTPNFKVQLSDGNAPVTPDAAPTFSFYGGSDTAVATGATTGPIDSKTGFYKVGQAFTAASGFTAGTTYTMRLDYTVSSVSKSQVMDVNVV